MIAASCVKNIIFYIYEIEVSPMCTPVYIPIYIQGNSGTIIIWIVMSYSTVDILYWESAFIIEIDLY